MVERGIDEDEAVRTIRKEKHSLQSLAAQDSDVIFLLARYGGGNYIRLSK